MIEEVVIIGSGGHSKVIIDILLKESDKKIIGILDDNYQNLGYDNILGVKILGKTDLIANLSERYRYIIAIGDNKTRQKIANKYSYLKYSKAIHPQSIIGENVNISAGTVVMANVVINSYSTIGKHCILNSSSIIEHDNTIEDFVHISPGATLCGDVKIGEASWIGARAIVIQGMVVQKQSVVGAGAVVINDVLKNSKVVGNPAVSINSEREDV
ncbi:MAG: acetyltransferase [Fusobacteriaceae bacterium]